MDVYKYLKTLSMRERATLSIEIECSISTINAAVTNGEFLSIHKAREILDSKFNKALPEYKQFKEEAYIEMDKARIAKLSS